MRILYHHRTLADGAEGVHIRAMVQAFRDLGHEVRLLGFAEAPTVASRRTVVDAIRSKAPKAAFELASMVYDQLERRKVDTEIKRYRPDLLYKRHGKFDTGALAAARANGVPSVLEVNCLFTSSRYASFEPLALETQARRLEQRALKLATLVVAVSSPLAADIRATGTRNVVTVPNGVDAQYFHPDHANGTRVRRHYGLQGTVIGWMGIIRDWHGVERLVDVIAADPELTALIIGDGPGRPALKEKAARLGIANRVTVTGRVPHEEIRDYLAALDIAIVTDERTGVASPMKLLEYMAMGRAVVAPRQANIADLIDDEIDGLLFHSQEPGDLAAKIGRLARSPELRQTLGRAARMKIEESRTWKDVAAAILAATAESHARDGNGETPQARAAR